jgi:hypothetical protein
MAPIRGSRQSGYRAISQTGDGNNVFYVGLGDQFDDDRRLVRATASALRPHIEPSGADASRLPVSASGRPPLGSNKARPLRSLHPSTGGTQPGAELAPIGLEAATKPRTVAAESPQSRPGRPLRRASLSSQHAAPASSGPAGRCGRDVINGRAGVCVGARLYPAPRFARLANSPIRPRVRRYARAALVVDWIKDVGVPCRGIGSPGHYDGTATRREHRCPAARSAGLPPSHEIVRPLRGCSRRRWHRMTDASVRCRRRTAPGPAPRRPNLRSSTRWWRQTMPRSSRATRRRGRCRSKARRADRCSLPAAAPLPGPRTRRTSHKDEHDVAS